MQILLLDDQGSVAIHLKPLLEDRGHRVFHAYSINDADSHLIQNSIDCLILDLNLSRDGLPKKYEKETKDGVLTGWVWVRNNVFTFYKNLRRSTIIYSDYLDDLKKDPNSSTELKGIKMLAKREDASIEKLLCLVDRIDKEIKHKS